jgi:hypothetical protein
VPRELPRPAHRGRGPNRRRRSVVSRWVLHGTHHGRRVTLPGITISRFENDKIAEDWTVFDNLGLLRQLGLRRGLALAARYAARRLSG